MTGRNVLAAPGAPALGTTLCRLDELTDPGARRFTFGADAQQFPMFLVRKGERVFAYVNSCPHVGSPLDFPPDRFLTPDKHHLRCATHGAVFTIDDGLCVAGPCPGARLSSVPIEIDAGTIKIASGNQSHG